MKKILILTLLILCVSNLRAQTDIPNHSFENWVEHESGLFLEPGDWWGTLNMLRLLGPAGPVTTSQSTDAHTGTYSAMIENKMFGTMIKIGGILSTGYFDTKQTPPDNFIDGRPFTGRPEKLIFWYKYKAVDGDSCGAGLFLTKWNTELNRADTIGKCSQNFYDQGDMEEFVKAEIPIEYFSEEQPDTINIAFIASAGVNEAGSSGNAVIGSTFWIDDVSVGYPTGIEMPLMSEGKVTVYGKPFRRTIEIHDHSNSEGNLIQFYDVNGRFISSMRLTQSKLETQFDMPKGTYFFVVKSSTKTVDGGIFNY